MRAGIYKPAGPEQGAPRGLRSSRGNMAPPVSRRAGRGGGRGHVDKDSQDSPLSLPTHVNCGGFGRGGGWTPTCQRERAPERKIEKKRVRKRKMRKGEGAKEGAPPGARYLGGRWRRHSTPSGKRQPHRGAPKRSQSDGRGTHHLLLCPLPSFLNVSQQTSRVGRASPK